MKVSWERKGTVVTAQMVFLQAGILQIQQGKQGKPCFHACSAVCSSATCYCIRYFFQWRKSRPATFPTSSRKLISITNFCSKSSALTFTEKDKEKQLNIPWHFTAIRQQPSSKSQNPALSLALSDASRYSSVARRSMRVNNPAAFCACLSHGWQQCSCKPRW